MVRVRKPPKQKKPYVYGLIDPRTGGMFYVGKGNGDRMNLHETPARRGKPGRKNDLIREILASGLRVRAVILEEFDNDDEAFAAEKRLIAEHKGTLLNMNGGGGGQYGLGAFGYFKAKARRNLKGLLPFEVWALTASREAQEFCIKYAGSLRGFYDKIKAEMEAEAIQPSPNTLTIHQDGSHELGWEY